MSLSQKNIVLKVSEKDNVAIVPNPGGLNPGTLIDDKTGTIQFIPMGHKVALYDIEEGSEIIRYGHSIGTASKFIKAGDWVQEQNIKLPDPPDLDSIPGPAGEHTASEPLNGYTFMGYKNPDGSVGTKNMLGISTSVQCVGGLANILADRITKELLPFYPNVDGVVALTHTYGCGVAINAPAAIVPIRTIRNLITNPNLGGEIFIIGLGCEKLQPESLLADQPEIPQPGKNYFPVISYMQDESLHGYEQMIDYFMKVAGAHLEKLNKRKREVCPASDLVVGMQCGGSDAFSGITANPTAGFAADLIVRAGGTVMFSEVTEVRDAVHLLVPRTINAEVGKALIEQMKWYDAYLSQGKADRSANPSPGNKTGGLSNVVEKALGSIVKSGTTPIVDVLGPGEKIRRKGLIFNATPASDFICGTLQCAAGMNVHVFMTGRGTPYGLSMVPVIKVSSNSSLSKRWFDLTDIDTGQIASGEKTIEEMGWELFQFILDVASGKKQVACDKLGLHNDLVLFNPGPVT